MKCLCAQVRGPKGDSRGLLWVLDEELVTPNSSENTVLERICDYFSDTGTQITGQLYFIDQKNSQTDTLIFLLFFSASV